jgi:hypothetical protein
MRATQRLAIVLTGVTVLVAVTTGGSSQAARVSAAQKAFDKHAAQVAKVWRVSAVAATVRQGLTLFSDTQWRPNMDQPFEPLDPDVEDALLMGRFVFAIPRPPQPPPGTVTFADGGTLTVPLESAYQAYQQLLVPDPRCPAELSCTKLTITGVQLTTRHLMTGRGEADVPVWRFTVAGIDKTVDQVAVAPSAMTPVPAEADALWGTGSAGVLPPYDPALDFSFAITVKQATGTALTFRAYARQACDSLAGPLVYEDTRTVVVGMAIKHAPPDTACTGSLYMQWFTVTLASPIGGRVVLDVLSGHPMMLTAHIF